MGYILTIKRTAEISEVEWLKVVEACATIKIDSAPMMILNSKTGQTLSMVSSATDVAVKFSSGGFLGMDVKIGWEENFRFSEG